MPRDEQGGRITHITMGHEQQDGVISQVPGHWVGGTHGYVFSPWILRDSCRVHTYIYIFIYMYIYISIYIYIIYKYICIYIYI